MINFCSAFQTKQINRQNNSQKELYAQKQNDFKLREGDAFSISLENRFEGSCKSTCSAVYAHFFVKALYRHRRKQGPKKNQCNERSAHHIDQ